MNLEYEERITLLGALDTLSDALASHGHQWTESERAIYEQALEIILKCKSK